MIEADVSFGVGALFQAGQNMQAASLRTASFLLIFIDDLKNYFCG
jgi:hypothetical protein